MLATIFEPHADGRRLRVARLGSGRPGAPPLVLLHGYPDNLQIWSELAPRLAQTNSVIAFDWPGMGYSEAWPSTAPGAAGAAPGQMAERIFALLNDWGLDRVGLAAMDIGGQAALAFAATYRERVAHLIIMNSLVYGDEQTSWEIRLLRRHGLNRFILNRLPSAVFRRALGTFRRFSGADRTLPADLRADFWQSFRRPEVRRFIARLCAEYEGALSELPQLYGRIGCPTLVLWGGRDTHFPPAHASRLHADIPDSRLEIIAHGEHWMALDLAAEVAARIRAFQDPL